MLQWNALVQVLRYVVDTKHLCLMYGGKKQQLIPTTYCDADWAGDVQTLKSTSGWICSDNGWRCCVMVRMPTESCGNVISRIRVHTNVLSRKEKNEQVLRCDNVKEKIRGGAVRTIHQSL